MTIDRKPINLKKKKLQTVIRQFTERDGGGRGGR